jgi:hypothetical protein
MYKIELQGYGVVWRIFFYVYAQLHNEKGFYFSE